MHDALNKKHNNINLVCCVCANSFVLCVSSRIAATMQSERHKTGDAGGRSECIECMQFAKPTTRET